MNKNNVFINSSSLKMLIALYVEDLDPMSLLYKVSLMDFKSDISSNNIRNINAFGFYLKNYRTVLNKLYGLFLIKVNNDKLSLTFDGKGVIERLNDTVFVKSLLQTSLMIKNDAVSSSYQELYLNGLEQYTRNFVIKEGIW